MKSTTLRPQNLMIHADEVFTGTVYEKHEAGAKIYAPWSRIGLYEA
jgi:hypothetical protein